MDQCTELEFVQQGGGTTGNAVTRPGSLTIRDAGERWVRYVERELGRERTTWAHYEQQLRDHLCPAVITRHSGERQVFGDILAERMTAPDVESLKDTLLAKLGAKMTGRLLTVARMLFNDIERRGEIASNPARAVKVRQARRGEDEVEIPEKDQVRALVKAISTVPPAPLTFTEVWIRSTLFSGLRPSENRGAAIEDLVLDGKAPGIHVRRRADEWNRIGPVKTDNGRRFVPLPPGTVTLLRRWLLIVPRGHRKDDSSVDGVPDPENPARRLHLLFPTELGTVQSLGHIRTRVWVPAMIKANLVDWVPVIDAHGRRRFGETKGPILQAVPHFKLNCLRHLAASLMIEDGLDAKTIQTRMGHGSIQVTYDMYGHLFSKHASDASAIARIERNLLGEPVKPRRRNPKVRSA